MIIDMKMTSKDFYRLLDYIDLFIENIAELYDTDTDKETLEAQIDLLHMKRSIAQYTLNYKDRHAMLDEIEELLKTCYELKDLAEIREDLIKQGLIEDDKVRRIKDLKLKRDNAINS